MRDAVFGAATGYTAAQVGPFLRSLRATGFAGEVVLFVYPTLSAADRAALRGWGAELVFVHRGLSRLAKGDADRRFNARLAPLHRRVGRLLAAAGGGVGRELRGWFSGLFHHLAPSRFVWFDRHLRNRPGRYRRVALCDVRDVVFQADPFADPFPAPVVYALEAAHTTLGGERSNADWVRRFYGEPALAAVADRRVANCGTVFGTADGLRRLLAVWVREMVSAADRGVGQFGLDQAAYNVLLWSGRLGEAAAAENGGRLVFTAANEQVDRFRISDGVLRADDGRPVAVVHMYDRHPRLRELTAARG